MPITLAIENKSEEAITVTLADRPALEIPPGASSQLTGDYLFSEQVTLLLWQGTLRLVHADDLTAEQQQLAADLTLHLVNRYGTEIVNVGKQLQESMQRLEERLADYRKAWLDTEAVLRSGAEILAGATAVSESLEYYLVRGEAHARLLQAEAKAAEHERSLVGAEVSEAGLKDFLATRDVLVAEVAQARTARDAETARREADIGLVGARIGLAVEQIRGATERGFDGIDPPVR